MPTIVKRTSPYRGVFVKRMRPNSSMHEQNKNLPYSRRHSFSHEYTGLMEQRRGVMKGKVESDFDENELKRLDQIISDENDKRHFTIKDYEEVRKKNREGRFIPSLTQMFQQKTNLPEVYRIHATKPNDVRLDIRVEDHQQQQPTNEVGYVSDSSISSDEDPVEREEIILTPVRSAPTPSGSPRTPTGPRKRPSLGTPEYDLAIPPVSPVTTPERPCPPVKSYDEVYDENYATLMAIVPVVPLHCKSDFLVLFCFYFVSIYL